jgi:hypothetical protein
MPRHPAFVFTSSGDLRGPGSIEWRPAADSGPADGWQARILIEPVPEMRATLADVTDLRVQVTATGEDLTLTVVEMAPCVVGGMDMGLYRLLVRGTGLVPRVRRRS